VETSIHVPASTLVNNLNQNLFKKTSYFYFVKLEVRCSFLKNNLLVCGHFNQSITHLMERRHSA